MDAEQVLATAWKAVESSGVPQELQATAFQLAVEITREATGPSTPVAPSPQSAAPHTPPPTPATVPSSDEVPEPVTSAPAAPSEDDLWVKFAEEAEVEREHLEELFYFSNGEVHLNVKAHKLAATKPSQMKAVAFALTVAYDFAFDRTALDTTIARAECERLKCLDKKNFGTYMGAVDGLTTSGPATKRVLKIKSGARDLFKGWVSKMIADPAGDPA